MSSAADLRSPCHVDMYEPRKYETDAEKDLSPCVPDGFDQLDICFAMLRIIPAEVFSSLFLPVETVISPTPLPPPTCDVTVLEGRLEDVTVKNCR